MPKIKELYPEIDDIQEDFSALKSDTAELARHVQSDGTQKAADISSNLKARAAEQLHKAEKLVKEKPVQGIAMAFAAGFLASILLGRR